MSYREVENDEGAIQVFDYMVRQVDATWRSHRNPAIWVWVICTSLRGSHFTIDIHRHISYVHKMGCLNAELGPMVPHVCSMTLS